MGAGVQGRKGAGGLGRRGEGNVWDQGRICITENMLPITGLFGNSHPVKGRKLNNKEDNLSAMNIRISYHLFSLGI